MAAPTRLEDHVKWRFTRCLNDIVIKSIAASVFTILGTKLFLKKQVSVRGSTIAGVGIAIGMSYHNCEKEMQQALTAPCRKEQIKKHAKGEDDCLDLDEVDGKQIKDEKNANKDKNKRT